jgi:hypothetical protein
MERADDLAAELQSGAAAGGAGHTDTAWREADTIRPVSAQRNPSPELTFTGRWRRRSSRRMTRRIGRLVLIAAFLTWCWAVHQWAAAHHYEALLRGTRPLYPGLAAVTFWPTVGLLWCVAYPSDVWPASDMRPHELPND